MTAPDFIICFAAIIKQTPQLLKEAIFFNGDFLSERRSKYWKLYSCDHGMLQMAIKVIRLPTTQNVIIWLVCVCLCGHWNLGPESLSTAGEACHNRNQSLCDWSLSEDYLQSQRYFSFSKSSWYVAVISKTNLSQSMPQTWLERGCFSRSVISEIHHSWSSTCPLEQSSPRDPDVPTPLLFKRAMKT